MFKKGLTAHESMKRMEQEGVKRIIVTYKDTAIGRGVLNFENGRFTRLLTVANHPRVTLTVPIPYKQGLRILEKILDGVYIFQTCFIISDEKIERNVEEVRKEVVCL